jgi:alpha-N-arabinofuranosidase
VRPRERAETAIDRRIFGNFLEHLGSAIYGGLSAQVLLNPDLEQIEPTDTSPLNWTLSGGAEWATGGCHSERCVELSPGGSLCQQVYLPLHRTRSYLLYLRTSSEGPGKLCVKMYRGGKRIATEEKQVEPGEWRRWNGLLYADHPPIYSDEPEEVEFSVTAGTVRIDRLVMLANDHEDRLDPEVMRFATGWHIPLLRYPGGNFVSGYHWRDGIGMMIERPTRRNPAWGGAEPNEFGTGEFIELCRKLGCEPQITVNAGDGTPEEAAGWVRYCNGEASASPEAELRDNGWDVAPYNVKLWEVGNELYGPWQIGYTDPGGNAERYVRFRDAMLAADESIELIATGQGDRFTPEGWRACMAWNEALLKAAAENGGKLPDYLSLHPLVPAPEVVSGLPYDEQFESVMAQPEFLDRVILPETMALIAQVGGEECQTRIAVTEWGIIVGGSGWREAPNHDAQSGAVFNALTLNAMLRHADQVAIANMTAFMHGGGITKRAGRVYVDPQYWVQERYAGVPISHPVAVTSTGPAHDIPARGQLPALDNVPDVDVFAAASEDGRSVTVFLVNRRLECTQSVSLRLEGASSAVADTWLLTTDDPNAGNSPNAPDNVRPCELEVQEETDGSSWTLQIPAHSVASVQFELAS